MAIATDGKRSMSTTNPVLYVFEFDAFALKSYISWPPRLAPEQGPRAGDNRGKLAGPGHSKRVGPRCRIERWVARLISRTL